MRKGIAIQTILLLLVGVLVVGILVYLVYKYTTGSNLSVQDCNGSLSAICTTCSIGGWKGSLSSDYKSTINTCNDYSEFSNFPTDPAGCGNIQTACGYLGIK